MDCIFWSTVFIRFLSTHQALLNVIKHEQFWSWIFADCKSDYVIIWGLGGHFRIATHFTMKNVNCEVLSLEILLKIWQTRYKKIVRLCAFSHLFVAPTTNPTLKNNLKISSTLCYEQNIPKCHVLLKVYHYFIVTNELNTWYLWTPFSFTSRDHVDVTISKVHLLQSIPSVSFNLESYQEVETW